MGIGQSSTARDATLPHFSDVLHQGKFIVLRCFPLYLLDSCVAHFVIAAPMKPKKANTLYYRILADELINRGHNVTFLVTRHQLVSDEPNPIFLSWPSQTATKWRDALFLYTFARRHQPDCLISQFSTVNICMLIGAFTGIPTRVAWYRTLYKQVRADAKRAGWVEHLKLLRKRFVYRFATHIIANSQASAEDVEVVYHLSANKVSVLHNLVSPPEIEHTLRVPNRLVSVGRFTPSKNQQVLVEALSLIREHVPSVHADFYGSGAQRGVCEARAAELGVASLCTFHGHVPLPKVMQALASASVCVVTSRNEAFGYVAAEAQAVGTPVVASEVDGILEVVQDGKTGFLVPPEDAAAFAEKIRVLLLDDALREQFGVNAREHFLSNFSMSNITQHADHLEQLTRAK